MDYRKNERAEPAVVQLMSMAARIGDMLPAIPQGYTARMPRHKEAKSLRSVGSDTSGREAHLTPAAADAWLTMQQRANEHGAPLLLVSAFRSIARQSEILKAKLDSGVSWIDVLSVNAFPGFSEHHSGRAIDLGAPNCNALTEDFETTEQFAWLLANAIQFGFALSYPRNNPFGIAYEPWHWCFQKTRA